MIGLLIVLGWAISIAFVVSAVLLIGAVVLDALPRRPEPEQFSIADAFRERSDYRRRKQLDWDREFAKAQGLPDPYLLLHPMKITAGTITTDRITAGRVAFGEKTEEDLDGHADDETTNHEIRRQP